MRPQAAVIYILAFSVSALLMTAILFHNTPTTVCCQHHAPFGRLFTDDKSKIPSEEFSDARIQDYLSTFANKEIEYESYTLPKPHFVHKQDEKLFLLNLANLQDMVPPTPDRLRGIVHTVVNGSVSEAYDCGWKGNTSVYFKPPKGRVRRRFRVVVPLLVPQSNSFQHFVDGMLPKLVQASSVLRMPNVTVLMYRPWDRIINEMLGKFNITLNNVHYYGTGFYSADYLVNTCVTPPLHPYLWNVARNTLGAHAHIKWPLSKAHVVLIDRKGSRNYGRNMDNFADVYTFMDSRYGANLRVFRGGYNLKESIDLFSKSRLVVGVHGGAFYNLIFSPEETNVLEILPTHINGTFAPQSIAFNIVWKMAAMLNQPYWRMSEAPKNPLGDVSVSIPKLRAILDEIDKKLGLH